MRFILVTLCCFFSLLGSAQDKIQIRNLGEVNGEITSFTYDYVFVKIDTSTKKLRYEVIESIKMQNPERLRAEIVKYRQAALLVYGRFVSLSFKEQQLMDSITRVNTLSLNVAMANNAIFSNSNKMYWTADQHYNRGSNLLVATGVFYVASFITAVFVPDMIEPASIDPPTVPSNINTTKGYQDFTAKQADYLKKSDEILKDYKRDLNTIKVVSGVFSLIGTICLFSANTNFKMAAYKTQSKISLKASPSSATLALQF